MRRFRARLAGSSDAHDSGVDESKYSSVRLHLGTNSLSLALAFLICTFIAFDYDVLKWNYLKGINHDLAFFMGMFSVILGVGFYKFWRLGDKSVYVLHLTGSHIMPKGVHRIFDHKGLSFGVSSKTKLRENVFELSSLIRQVLCIGIFLNIALITLGNAGFDKLKNYPTEVIESTKSEYCEDEEDILNAPPKAGCELIVRAYKLGYAKDLGICEPKKLDPEKLEVCLKRRKDEPYFHYKSRFLLSFADNTVEFFENNKVKQIEEKFKLQLEELEVLRDYQRYAMSAAPRASHHIWTNLPHPENKLVEQYRDIFRPSYCIEQFQNQTNTVRLQEQDSRKQSKIMEHVYGQTLFNPKHRHAVAFCKEYQIHWDSETNTCERLRKDPKAVLQQAHALPEVEQVLRRHDIAISILNLEEKINEIEGKAEEEKNKKAKKKKIVKGKIAKDKTQIRKKSEIVSFQCFMQAKGTGERQRAIKLDDTKFVVRTRYFPEEKSVGGGQIAMYKEFSKLMEKRFHYSKLTSRSDIDLGLGTGAVASVQDSFEAPSYLFTRLERLKNVDIFLGNQWIFERDDLLEVYPYHVHLKNYVKSFRGEYSKSRGRL